ncbi:hypothetical protein C8J57DRAFT_1231212 [Mycena rebaudengoi]|nr:hypothetical protein C8J57DRAFT_1231212 [Mycena rebaudengoi]
MARTKLMRVNAKKKAISKKELAKIELEAFQQRWVDMATLLESALAAQRQLTVPEALRLEALVDEMHDDMTVQFNGEWEGDRVDRGDSDASSDSDSSGYYWKDGKHYTFGKSEMEMLAVKAKRRRLRKGDFTMLIIADAVDNPSGNVVKGKRSPAPALTALPSEANWRAVAAATKPNGDNLSALFVQLQQLASEVAALPNPPPTTTNIHEHGMMFVNNKAKMRLEGRGMSGFSTVGNFAKYGTETVHLGLFISWTKPPTGPTAETFISYPLHCCIGAIISAKRVGGRSAGKTLLDNLDNILNANFREIFKQVISDRKVQRIFVNKSRAERNTGGHCFALALEWMVEMVVMGLQIEWDEAGAVKAVEGFREINTVDVKVKKIDK